MDSGSTRDLDLRMFAHLSGGGTRSLKIVQAARLRLPPSLSKETVALIVEQTIDELGLRDAADTVVGGPLRKGISGGEKRSGSIPVSGSPANTVP